MRSMAGGNESPKAILRGGREKSLLRAHPWVFSGAIDKLAGAPGLGETVDVCSPDGGFLARAAFSPASQIRLRVWTFDRDELVDERFFHKRLSRAIAARRTLGLLDDEEGACRLVFGEADGLPGLIVDRYAGFLVCQILAAGAERWRETIVDALVELVSPLGIYERSESAARRREGLASRQGVLYGDAPPDSLLVRSGAVLLPVDVRRGQKTGAYLDQQHNRAVVAARAAGARVLDAFAYSGGFAVSCLKAGAESATLLEASAEALKAARHTAELNGVGERCDYRQGDVFAELRRMREEGARFDVVILDPPKFVHSVEQLSAGSRGYKDINWLGFQLVEEGGVLATFSCSGHVDAALFQKIVAGAAMDAGRNAQVIAPLPQPPDHPIALAFPESAYLKGFLLRVW